MDQALDILPADYWRYVLMANAPENSDAAFTWELLQVKINNELAAKYGNFVNRTLKLTTANYSNNVPAGGEPGRAEEDLLKRIATSIKAISYNYEKLEFRKACEELRNLWDIGNAYFDEREPWKLVKTDSEAGALVLRTCINLIRIYAIASAPIMPTISKNILTALHTSEVPFDELAQLDALKAGHNFDEVPIQFTKIEDTDIADYKKRFGGE